MTVEMRREKVAGADPSHGRDAFCPLSAVGSSTLVGIYLAFLLLLVAMVVTPAMVVHGPELPRAATATRLSASIVDVGLDPQGVAYFEDRAYRDSRLLAEAIGERFQGVLRQEWVIALQADRNQPYHHALDVLDAARAAGVARIELVVECPGRRRSHWQRCER